MAKPLAPADGASGKWAWHTFVHTVVDRITDENGEVVIEADPGRDPEIDVVDDEIVWRLVGDETWQTVVPLADLIGPEGKRVELRVTATHVQWRHEGDETWTDLIALDDLKGAKGDQGDPGPQGLVWRGAWDNATAYDVHDGVAHNGSSWVAVEANTGSEPSTANTDWDQLARAGAFEDAVLSDLNDVDTAGAAAGNALVFESGTWVPGDAGKVDSVNGQDGVVVLDAGDVGADPAGTAAGAVGAHEASSTAHPAASVTVDPAGLEVVEATDVQGAIAELDAAAASGSYMSITQHGDDPDVAHPGGTTYWQGSVIPNNGVAGDLLFLED